MAGNLSSGMEERRVAIIGAGDVGEALAKDLLSRNGNGLHPVFFVDDDPVKIGRSVHGLPVYGPLDKLLKLGTDARVNELVIAMTSPPPKLVKIVSSQTLPPFGGGVNTNAVPWSYLPPFPVVP